MKESDLYGGLWRGANAEGWSLFRIADGSVGKKPGDVAGCAPNGVAVLLEAKLVLRRPAGIVPERLCLPAYKLHQLAWLRRYVEARALALAYERDAATGVERMFWLNDTRHLSTSTMFDVGAPERVHMGRDDRGLVRGWARLLGLHASWAGLPCPPPAPYHGPP